MDSYESGEVEIQRLKILYIYADSYRAKDGWTPVNYLTATMAALKEVEQKRHLVKSIVRYLRNLFWSG